MIEWTYLSTHTLCVAYRSSFLQLIVEGGGSANNNKTWHGMESVTNNNDNFHLTSSTAHTRVVRTNPGTRAEPQQIVAQRLLSCLQYPVPFKSSTEDLTRPTFGSVVK
jgi:hypothetical protein